MVTTLRKFLVLGFVMATIGFFPGFGGVAHAQDRTVTVATFEEEPFVFNRNGVKTGFTIDLLDAIGQYNGWTMVYKDEPVTNSKGLLKVLAAGGADIAATSITITADRLKQFDFTQPTLDSGAQIVVAADRAEPGTPGLAEFLKLLFSKNMLIWIGAALALAVIPAHIVWLLERRSETGMVSRSYFPGIFQALQYVLGMLVAANDDDPRGWHSRALGVLWAFVGIVFVAFYTATLTANLTVQQFDEQISSTSDLVGNRVCAVTDSTTAKYIASVGVRFDGVPNITDCYARLKDRKTDAIVADASLMEYWVGHEGRAVGRLAGPMLNPDSDGIACRLNDPLCNEIDEALIALRETGEYQLIKEKWFPRPDSE